MEIPRFVSGGIGLPRGVRIATAPDDLRRIFELRYEVYVEEHARLVRRADHVRRQLRDAHDDTAIHLMSEVDGQLAACARLHLGGIPARLAAPLELGRFHGWSPSDLGFISKFMIGRGHRGSTVAARLMRAFFALAVERGVHAVFCTTFPDLVPLYERAGMVAYGSEYNDAELGPHRAMVFLMPTLARTSTPAQLEHMESAGVVAPGEI